MIRLQRLAPFARVFAWMCVLCVGVNLALHALEPTPVLAWLPRKVAGTGFLEDNQQRVAGAREEYRKGLIAADNHLAAIVGISNVREGVDLHIMNQVAGPTWHLLGLGGSGLTVRDVALHADVLLSSDLKPEVLILAISLDELLDTRPKPGAWDAGLKEYLRRGDFRNVAISVRSWLWFYSRRQDVSLTVDTALLTARERLFRLFGVQLAQAGRGHLDPWREMIKAGWPEHFSEATLREEEQFFDGLGAFDLRTYQSSPRAMATLLDLIQRSRDHSQKVALVLMPAHSTLRRRIPAGALDVLSGSLRRAFGDDAPPILDFRSVVDDSSFVDLTHMNEKGRNEFSRLLAERICQHASVT